MFPAGVDKFEESPWEFQMLVSHALLILQWQENLRPHEMPEQWMWPHAKELEEWFEEVDIARRQEFGDPEERGVPMVRNELAKDF